ncbi:glycoside hydrolase family protein, partial [Flavobacterium sp.]|uniref:glycoside hydrolase family protein n=1 Tax=Flavobacterium sp. TaxID=239 RepID=UPI00286DEA36
KAKLTELKKFAKVDAIEKALTKDAYNKDEEITFDVYKSVTENLWLKAECQGTKKYSVESLKKEGQYFVIGKTKEIIFPLLVKPENDIGNKWYNSYNWAATQGNNMATFNTTRSGNKCGSWTRKHAARDLYTKPETEVVAICKGTVLEVKDFYSKTNQVTVLHETTDGRKFIVRYGELAPNSITVKKDDPVTQKQKLGVTGKLLQNDNTPLLIRDGQIVYMLHFELYSGLAGLNIDIPLSNCEAPFARRNDLIEPLEILQEGYASSFNDKTQNNGDRVDADTLHFSQNGINFLKGYETEIKKDGKHVYFDDGYGFCTIGYGHLIAGKKSCSNITMPTNFLNGLTDAEADALLFQDVQRISNLVKSKVTVDLYQYEFDALVSLAFNVEASVGSESTLLRMLNAANYDGAANEFKNWRIADGVVSPGLVIRRAQEKEIFKNNTYDSTH